MKRLSLSLKIILLIGFVVFWGGCGDDGDKAALYGWAVGSNVDGYGTIIHTKNGGITWVRQGPEMIPDIPIDDVAAIDHNNVWVVGLNSVGEGGISYGTILRTTDGGETWIRQGSGSSIPDVGLSGVSAVDNEVAWVVGSSGTVLRTIDGGITWVQQAQGMLPDALFQMVSAFDRNNVWAVGTKDNDTNAFIIHTTDGGTTWVMQGENDIPADVAGLIDIHAVNERMAWTVGTGCTALVTTDGGNTWSNKSPQCGLLHVNGVCGVNDQIAWLAVDSNVIFYTRDGGDTWLSQKSLSSVGETVSSALLGVTAINERTAWIVGSYPIGDNKAIILHTTDGGKNWRNQTSPANSFFRRVSFAGALR
jgi:photosystem II stability/assembly factor-like uncharacterized protein